MTPAEIRASAPRHRSPLLLRCMEDYLAGLRHPLSLIYTDPGVTAPKPYLPRTLSTAAESSRSR